MKTTDANISELSQRLPALVVFSKEEKKALWSFIAKQESECTKKAYLTDLNQLFARFPLTVRQFERHHLVQFKNELKEKYSTATVARRIACVRAFFQWLYELELIDRDPSFHVKPPKQDTLQGKTPEITDAEVKALLAAPDKKKLIEFRDFVIMELLFYTGIRNSELRFIRNKDVAIEGGQTILTVTGKGNQKRRIPLRGFIADDIEEYKRRSGHDWSDPDAFLFTAAKGRERVVQRQPISAMRLLNIVGKYAKRAGIQSRVVVHSARVTATSHALDHGATDSEILNLCGWRSRDMVARYNRRRDSVRTNAAHKISY